MSSEVTSPFTVFYDRSGEPLDAGYIYIGTAGINPEVSPIAVYWDEALTIPAVQPIRTLAGYPSRDGSPGTIITTAASYSIVVRDRNGALIYSDLNAFMGLGVINFVATYAALTALTAATGLIDGAVYYTRSRATEDDGGAGNWRYDSASTATANGGTILAIDGGGAGRFVRLLNKEDYASIEWFGGNNDGATTNTAVYNAWLTAATAGTAPKTLKFGNGTYLFLTKPDRIETSGINIEGSSSTTVKMGFSAADRTEALFHFYGGASFGTVSDMAIGTHDNGSSGGSLIRLEATSADAPSNCRLTGLYLTSYATVSTLVVSAISNAVQGVFTSVAHGYSAGQHVSLASLAGGTFDTLNETRYTIAPSPAADTFRLYSYGTTTFIDTSSLGSYSASSGTVKRTLCADAPISIDGTAKSTGAQGVRVTDITSCTIFGGGEASIYASGYRALSIHGGNISSAGWVGRPLLTGSVSVEGQNAILSALSLPGIKLDLADETNFRASNNTGTITTTGSTGDIYRQLLLDSTTSGQGVVIPSGTQDITVSKAAPVISMVETDNSNVITRVRGVAGALNIEVDPTALASGSVIYLIADGTTTWQTGAGEHFTSVPIYPLTDGAIDLGAGSFRFQDIWATNATIQTSDERIKQNVSEFTPAELRAARKIAKLIRTYRMISAVQEKGDKARIHTGLIAQRVAEALESEGLDPWRYAFMCRDLIEWQDPLFGQRAAVADAENRLPETEAALADAIAQRDAEVSSAHAEAKFGIAKAWSIIIDNLQKRLDGERMTAQMNVPLAPAWFAPYERLSLRYGEIWPWMIAAQEQRLNTLEIGVQP